MAARPVTLEEVRTWPATVDLPEAAEALGISRAQAYVSVKRGDFPAKVITVGRPVQGRQCRPTPAVGTVTELTGGTGGHYGQDRR
jgi:predicted DNA-binding transcriptional regulator AlpA